MDIDKTVARKIIETVANSGQPPAYGFHYFNAGPNTYYHILEKEYLETFIKDGGSVFKMVCSVYGGGKTHFLYVLRDLAWKHKYAVSVVRLSPKENPFHRLDLVYRAIIDNIIPPVTPQELLSGFEHGISSFIKSWYAIEEMKLLSKGLSGNALKEELIHVVDGIDEFASISFGNAVKGAFRALALQQNGDFDKICQWFKLEGTIDRTFLRKIGVTQKIDASTAFQMIRSLAQWIRQIGNSGLVILLDEGERHASLSSGQKDQHLMNMREIIDECSNPNFQSIMIVYAVPDETFLNGKTSVYDALKSRLQTVFDVINPTGVKIDLEKLVPDPIPFLCDVGNKLASIYEIAYDYKFDKTKLEKIIMEVANESRVERFGDVGYKRSFVLKIIPKFNKLRLEPQ